MNFQYLHNYLDIVSRMLCFDLLAKIYDSSSSNKHKNSSGELGFRSKSHMKPVLSIKLLRHVFSNSGNSFSIMFLHRLAWMRYYFDGVKIFYNNFVIPLWANIIWRVIMVCFGSQNGLNKCISKNVKLILVECVLNALKCRYWNIWINKYEVAL